MPDTDYVSVDVGLVTITVTREHKDGLAALLGDSVIRREFYDGQDQ